MCLLCVWSHQLTYILKHWSGIICDTLWQFANLIWHSIWHLYSEMFWHYIWYSIDDAIKISTSHFWGPWAGKRSILIKVRGSSPRITHIESIVSIVAMVDFSPQHGENALVTTVFTSLTCTNFHSIHSCHEMWNNYWCSLYFMIISGSYEYP
jgi:hypothetical protein